MRRRQLYSVIFASLVASLTAGLTACSSDPDCPVCPDAEGAEDTALTDTGADTTAETDTGVTTDTGAPSDGGDDDTSTDAGELLPLGAICTDDDECLGNVCLRIAAGLDEGFCSGFCYEAEDCGEAEWDCIFLLNSGADAAFLCAPEDLCIDRDGDDYGIGPGCTGSDCDDDNAAVNPGADELCDGLDNDCDSNVDDNPADTNVDCSTGYPGECATGRTRCTSGVLECIGFNSPVAEICDTLDNDCDGTADLTPAGDPLMTECYGGPAGTLGIGQCVAGVRLCTDGALGECDGQILPNPEVCDGVDNDCDGEADEDNPGAGFLCETGLEGVCSRGTTSCEDGADVCVQQTEASDEVCDALDNDCDGETDEDEDGLALAVGCYEGPDGTEDVGVCVGGVRTCNEGEFGICEHDVIPGIEVCDGLDNDCDGETDEGDPAGGFNCDTGLLGLCAQGQTTCDSGGTECAQLFFPSPEVCDGFDNDCDGDVDELDDGSPLTEACYTGPAGTEDVGVCHGGTRTCMLGEWQTCQDQTIPALVEICDGSDNDCDGTIDEESAGTGVACSTGLAGACAEGTTVCNAGTAECVPTIEPDTVPETCDGVDNDCDGTIDDGAMWADLGDTCSEGIGICLNMGVRVCDPGDPAGATVCSATPGAPEAEVCDGVDNNCDGNVDEGAMWSDLGDGCLDGVGACQAAGIRVCDAGDPAGATVCSAVVGAPTAEVCDGIDNDCNGTTDDGFTTGEVCSVGLGECAAVGVTLCNSAGDGTTCSATAGTPSAEVCDGLDNNCDGSVDEGYGLGAVCTVGTGACLSTGTLLCTADGTGTTCSASAGTPTAEICDGMDNDCDGVIDNGFNVGQGCSAGVGECLALGSMVCSPDGASTVCDASEGSPAAEVCDGLDNDCDGTIDDGFNVGTACTDGVGECLALGSYVCSADGSGTECNASAGSPVSERCDGLDNDCDGTVDDGFNVGTACASGVGECRAIGSYVCSADGSGTDCTATPSAPIAELCDGLDNDCDGTADDGIANLGDTCFAGLGICRQAGVYICDADPSDPATCDATPGVGNPSETCDYLDDDCDGDVDEDFTNAAGDYNQTANCGGCGVDCNALWVPSAASFHVSPFCGSTSGVYSCDYACEAGYFDLDLDPSNGCEFTPDPGTIYVATPVNGGSDTSSCGAYTTPCATIQHGIDRAAGTAGKDTVRVSAGIYRENIDLSNGVDVLGGYNTVNWVRSIPVNVTTIAGQATASQDAITVDASSITAATTFSGFTIQAANGRNATSTLPAGNSIGIYVNASDNDLVIEDNVIRAGTGGNGALGSAGASGAAGADGGAGVDRIRRAPDCGITRPGGAGGATTCGGTNTSGGDGADSDCPTYTAGIAQPANDGGNGQNNPVPPAPNRPATDPGEGGDGAYHLRGWTNTGNSCTPSGDLDPIPGASGVAGSDSLGGVGASDDDGTFSGGQWRGADGSNGVSGTPGTGGGGGGAAGGVVDEVDNTYYYGATGGGGGAGGCGGDGGAAGSAGGGSFGILVSFAGGGPGSAGVLPVIRDNTIARGAGGNGGAGGTGGSGGDPGLGGAGGVRIPADPPNRFDFCMFAGAAGAEGGRGGHGGGGGGGAGGASYDIWVYNDNGRSNYSANTFDQAGTVDTGGIGGTGGNSSNTSTGLGTAGVDGDFGNVVTVD